MLEQVPLPAHGNHTDTAEYPEIHGQPLDPMDLPVEHRGVFSWENRKVRSELPAQEMPFATHLRLLHHSNTEAERMFWVSRAEHVGSMIFMSQVKNRAIL